jgi:FAD/FMN-containing dehydrogenase
MAGAEVKIAQRMRSLLGSEGIVETDASGQPRVAPMSEEAVALVLRTATTAGWKVRVEGSGNWMPPDGPSDLVITTRSLNEITYLNPGDLVATAQAGIPWGALRQSLADRGTWVAADPPGERRTLGSIVATGTAGPLRTGFGGIRDHLLGLTIATGDGHVLRPGGRVVKNVAGYDLTKLVAGSFGAFGIITSVHLRLRAVPREDQTLLATGSRDALLHEARAILAGGSTPAALELLSPRARGDAQWALAVRLSGTPGSVTTQRDAVRASVQCSLDLLATPEASRLWQELSGGLMRTTTTLRLGALPAALDDALDLLAHHLSPAHDLSDDWVSVTVPAGVVRWSGAAPPDRLRLMRHAAAQQEMPVTLERAPWSVREAVGHFGAYREGIARLVDRLRQTFDPAGVVVTAVGETN